MLKARQGGAIVNLSSMATQLVVPLEFADYAASKWAVESMTIGLSKEVAAKGIRLNAIRPGLIDTEIQAVSSNPNWAARLVGTVPMGGGLALRPRWPKPPSGCCPSGQVM